MALKPVGQDNLDHFEEDEEGRLYWRGALIVMEQRLIVPDAVNYSVIGAAIATGIMPAVSVVSYFWPAYPHP